MALSSRTARLQRALLALTSLLALLWLACAWPYVGRALSCQMPSARLDTCMVYFLEHPDWFSGTVQARLVAASALLGVSLVSQVALAVLRRRSR